MKLTIVVGMGGSGKTQLCKEIAESTGAKTFSDATLIQNDSNRAGFDCLGEMVSRLLGRHENCVMDESHLTVSSFRELFKRFCDEYLTCVEQEWIFFEHDTLACINNVYHDYKASGRDSLSRYEALLNQSRAYEVPLAGSYPGHQAARQVYKQFSPVFRDSREAVDWLRAQITRLKGCPD